MEELEALEPDSFDLPGEGPEPIAGFYRIDPAEFGAPESAGTIDNLVSAIEFSPDPQELEREKEEEARSMAEHFEIQSPFASIFSTLSEEELEPDPVEELESLEKEKPTPDDSPEREAEELRSSFTGLQLSVPFLATLDSEITFLEAEEDEDAPAAPEEEEAAALEFGQAPEEEAVALESGQAPESTEAGGVIMERDGIIYINERVLAPDKKTLKGLDRNFKRLIDAILNNT